MFKSKTINHDVKKLSFKRIETKRHCEAFTHLWMSDSKQKENIETKCYYF